MEVMDAIKTRYSVRKYADKAIEHEELKELWRLDAWPLPQATNSSTSTSS